ncbi:MAG: 30S ribosomal protein S18 [Anaerolineae bacterium]
MREKETISYKDVDLLRHFITERGKIRPRRQTGITAKQQRAIAVAVKRARHMALLPYTDEHIREVS